MHINDLSTRKRRNESQIGGGGEKEKKSRTLQRGFQCMHVCKIRTWSARNVPWDGDDGCWTCVDNMSVCVSQWAAHNWYI